MYAQTREVQSRDESRTRCRALSHHTKMGKEGLVHLWAHAFGLKT